MGHVYTHFVLGGQSLELLFPVLFSRICHILSQDFWAKAKWRVLFAVSFKFVEQVAFWVAGLYCLREELRGGIDIFYTYFRCP